MRILGSIRLIGLLFWSVKVIIIDEYEPFINLTYFSTDGE
jgi:hypothetical protein